jgi:cellulose synthase/poly-beta-1,6-N-acetylglucosamine synthase-like glycosyltransferase
LIVCYEKLDIVQKFIEGNHKILLKYPIIVVNKEGGEPLKTQQFNVTFFNQYSSFWFARRFGLEFVETEYVLNLDVDNILPESYVERAIILLESDEKIGAVALNYAKPLELNHLGFGTSICRTKDLKELYDWRLIPDFPQTVCECKYMWSKFEKLGKRVETFSMQAIHLMGPNRNIPLDELIRKSIE